MTISVTITVSNAVATEIQNGLPALLPIPTDPVTHQPLFTAAQWVKEVGRQFYANILRQIRRNNQPGIVDPDGDIT